MTVNLMVRLDYMSIDSAAHRAKTVAIERHCLPNNPFNIVNPFRLMVYKHTSKYEDSQCPGRSMELGLS